MEVVAGHAAVGHLADEAANTAHSQYDGGGRPTMPVICKLQLVLVTEPYSC